MSNTCLLMVDVQRGFINASTEHIPALVKAAQPEYEHVVATRFFNPNPSPFRTLLQWERFSPATQGKQLTAMPCSR